MIVMKSANKFSKNLICVPVSLQEYIFYDSNTSLPIGIIQRHQQKFYFVGENMLDNYPEIEENFGELKQEKIKDFPILSCDNIRKCID